MSWEYDRRRVSWDCLCNRFRVADEAVEHCDTPHVLSFLRITHGILGNPFQRRDTQDIWFPGDSYLKPFLASILSQIQKIPRRVVILSCHVERSTSQFHFAVLCLFDLMGWLLRSQPPLFLCSPTTRILHLAHIEDCMGRRGIVTERRLGVKGGAFEFKAGPK